MVTENQVLPRLNKASLYQLIAMHRNPVSRSSVFAIFGEGLEKRITALLTQLKNQGKIKETTQGYRAVRPWADIALATIGPVSSKKRATINILSLPEDVKINASVTRSDVYKHSLKEGDRVAVSLARGQAGSNELRARYIAHAYTATPLRLSGHFNAMSRAFTTTNHGLKTEFRLRQEPENDTSHLLVELPQNFDMRNPVLKPVQDQTIDPVSGEEITWIIARKHEIALAHPQNILNEAIILAQKPVLLDGRVDLRDLDFVTVDPLGAKDLDDAMCARIENNGYAFYTAIADVPYILPYMNEVDRDAFGRGLTHYLSNDHVAHMLPSVISTDKCSLVPHQDRTAIVVKQVLGWDFQLKGFEIFAALIRSKEQLSYGQFYDRLERNDPRFRILVTIHDTRRRQGLDKNMQAFLSDNPDKYTTKSMVETAMVQTNSLAAKYLSQKNMPFLSRNYSHSPDGHPGPRAFYDALQLGHKLLGLAHYAHISSPIRRYGDNINIRALHACFNTPGLGIDAHQIERLSVDAAHLNGRRDTDHKMMQQIERYHSAEPAKNPGLIPT